MISLLDKHGCLQFQIVCNVTHPNKTFHWRRRRCTFLDIHLKQYSLSPIHEDPHISIITGFSGINHNQLFIHSWTSRYCKPWVILRSLITDQMKVRQNLVAKWSLQRIAIFLSLKQTPTEMYQHKMLSSQTTHTYSIVGVIRVGTWYVAIRLKFIYLNIIIFSHFFLFFKFCLIILLSDY